MNISTKKIMCVQHVIVTDSLCLSYTVCVGHRESVSVTDILCLSHIVCVSNRQFVCHRQSVSVTDSLCL